MENRTKNPNAVREAKSKISITPIGDKVIVKMVAKPVTSNILIPDKVQSKDLIKPLFTEIVGYGELTHTIEIGDRIIIDSDARPAQPIFVKGNKNSYIEFMKKRNNLINSKGEGITNNDLIVEYSMISMYDIKAIDFTNYNDSN